MIMPIAVDPTVSIRLGKRSFLVRVRLYELSPKANLLSPKSNSIKILNASNFYLR